jgi:hypothetical protein
LPKNTTLELAKIMDKFDYPTNMEDIDKCKANKFEEFIKVYLLGDNPAPKSDPKSVRSILAIKRSLKLK